MKSRAKLIPLAALSAALLGGCAISGPYTSSIPQASQLYFFRGPKTVDKDYIDRYACADGRLLVCTCTSLHAHSCDCSC